MSQYDAYVLNSISCYMLLFSMDHFFPSCRFTWQMRRKKSLYYSIRNEEKWFCITRHPCGMKLVRFVPQKSFSFWPLAPLSRSLIIFYGWWYQWFLVPKSVELAVMYCFQVYEKEFNWYIFIISLGLSTWFWRPRNTRISQEFSNWMQRETGTLFNHLIVSNSRELT